MDSRFLSIGTVLPEKKTQHSSLTNEELKANLRKCTSTMDVPDFRKDDAFWLLRNMDVRNKDHSKFDEALKISKELAKRGVR